VEVRAFIVFYSENINEGAFVITQAIEDPESWVHVEFNDFHITSGAQNQSNPT